MVHEHMGDMPKRRDDSYKGDYGKVLVIAGSRGMTGAACLTALGALGSGSGLVTAGVPLSLNGIMEMKLTEIMTLPLPETGEGTFSVKAVDEIILFSKKCDITAVGPGLRVNKDTAELVVKLLKGIEGPMVLDADGINALGGKLDMLRSRKAGTVITPHPGEMAALLGKDVTEVQASREETARSVAETTGTVVCLKGHRTVVADPSGKVYVNDTGNSGMATAGSGDVLTGMIASFIGQGVGLFSSAVNAVYLHGLAGDIAAGKKGAFSMIASDIIDNLGAAFDRAGI